MYTVYTACDSFWYMVLTTVCRKTCDIVLHLPAIIMVLVELLECFTRLKALTLWLEQWEIRFSLLSKIKASQKVENQRLNSAGLIISAINYTPSTIFMKRLAECK